ncbi:MAG: hypothetical protein MUC67_06975 [Acidobacteria bacterium]|jgi:hypothetical protein|nr:hypothetical protein [Acidobacteriota bacterium]
MKIAEAQRRQLLLAGLLLVAVAGLGWNYRATIFGSGSAAAGREAADRVAPLDKQLASMVEIPSIPLDRPGAEEAYDRQRNLFEFSQSPESIAAERARKEAERRAEVERAEREARMARERQAEAARRALLPPEPPPPPPPPPPPQAPAFRYTYVAYIAQLQGAEEFIAVLQKREGKTTTEYVKVGDVLDKQFVVKKADIDQVVVGFTDPRFSDQTQSVRLIPAPPKR